MFMFLFYLVTLQDSWEDEENEKNQVSTPAPVAVSS